MNLKNLLSTTELVIYLGMLRVALDDVNVRRAIQRELGIGHSELSAHKRRVSAIVELTNDYADDIIQHVEAEEKAKTSAPDVIVQLDKYLDPFSFLVALETARVVLGNGDKREWLLKAMEITDEVANGVYHRLCDMMREIRSNEKQFTQPARDFPALESPRTEAV